jgi:hypothetical protein
MHRIRTTRGSRTEPEQSAIDVDFEAADFASVPVDAMKRAPRLVDEEKGRVVARRNCPPMGPFPCARNIEDLEPSSTRPSKCGRPTADVRPEGDIARIGMWIRLHRLTCRWIALYDYFRQYKNSDAFPSTSLETKP